MASWHNVECPCKAIREERLKAEVEEEGGGEVGEGGGGEGGGGGGEGGGAGPGGERAENAESVQRKSQTATGLIHKSLMERCVGAAAQSNKCCTVCGSVRHSGQMSDVA